MSLLTLRRRVEKLESIRVTSGRHVVVVFNGTPESDEQAEKLIAEGRVVAALRGKELQIIRIGWKT